MSIEFDASDLDSALAKAVANVRVRMRQGLESTCEAIAARARQTTTFKDRTSLLRQSIQEAGVEETGDQLAGLVSFAARSKSGYLYGCALEFGTHAGARKRTKAAENREAGARFKGPRQRSGIKARRFIRDAIDAQDGALLESALASAFRDAGFTVRGG